ncbi:MAG: hypothetical protein H5U01_00590 [Clostridia bacterium]|nr:hypothetical protein [Clostridia bacterium]
MKNLRKWGQPSWSPVANTLAYSTEGPGGGYAPDMNLKLASLVNGEVKLTALLPEGHKTSASRPPVDGRCSLTTIVFAYIHIDQYN